MVNGYAGTFLRVNLSKREITPFNVEETMLRRFLGGTGIGARFLYDEVPPGVGWADPANRLIFATGPLNGTTIGGSGSTSIVTKGPMTGGAACCQANGFFGAYIKLCGFDGVILEGAAQTPSYLHIETDSAELRDADWLRGRRTYDTADLVKHELNRREREMSVASIGPAGENCVKFAGILFDKGHSASHNGIGAVMGSKGLKAIAVSRGTKRIPLKDADGLAEVRTQFLENVKANQGLFEYGTLGGMHGNAQRNMIPVKNYTTSAWTIDEEKWKKFGPEYIRETFPGRRNSCWACQIHHCDMITITEGPYAGEELEEPEYEQFASWASAIGQEDVASAMMLSKEVDELGLENNEGGWVVGFAMECFERGILTSEDTGGLDLSWGNAEGARLLLNLIAKRQGLGDVLADGVMRAAQTIGKGATDFAIHTLKGNTPRSHDHRNRWTEMFDTCVSNTSTLETWGGVIPLGGTPPWNDLVAQNLHDKGAMMLEDSMVTCRFNTSMNVALLSRAVGAATGWDFSEAEGWKAGRRIVHLLRAFNLRHGAAGRALDRPSARYGSAPDAGSGKGITLVAHWEEMLDMYYQGMGWDEAGKPLPDTLKTFGLDYVVNDLWGDA
jgi:aldehyde:ferredoxin oxidoreductase